MTADTDIFRRAGVDGERDEQARLAVIEGRKMVSYLTSTARALTKRKDVQVVMATRDNGSTDGDKIYWRPPIALGDKTPHQRNFCNKREGLKLICPACEKREDVLVVIYHEIAHICFESFQPVSDDDKRNLVKDAIESTGGKWAKQIARRIEAAPYWSKSSYIGMAGLVSEFMPMLVNALEDARVNRELFKVRKGTKSMFDAQVTKTFNEGVEQLDKLGKSVIVKWCDYPLNAQALVGLFAKASGYTYTDWFQPQVIEALDDEKLTWLIRQLDTIRSASGVYHLSFPVLARLRELGFCKLPDEPEEEDGTESDDESSESGSDPGGDSDPSEHSESDSGSGGSEDSDSGDASPSESDSQTPSDEAGDSDDEGSDQDGDEVSADSSDGPSNDDGAASSSPAEDANLDNAGDSSSVGELDDSEDLGQEAGSGSGSEDGNSSGTDDDSEGDSAGEADSDEPQQTAESHHGTGDITGDPIEDDLDEETSSSGSDPSGDDTNTDSGSDAPEQSSSRSDEEEGDGSSESSVPDSSGSDEGDARGSDEGDSDRGDRDLDDSADQDTSRGARSKGDEGDSEGFGSDSDRDAGNTDGAGSETGDAEPSGREGSEFNSERSEDNDERPGEPSPSSEDDEVLDPGADRGLGGTEIVENEKNKDLPYGDAEDAKLALLKLGDHDEPPKKMHEEELSKEAVDRAIIQGLYFETPSRNVYGVREHRRNKPVIVDGVDMGDAWNYSYWTHTGHSTAQLGIEGDFDAPEQILAPALTRMRVAFTDNQRGKDLPHLKAGKVNGRVLGRRAWAEDERLFRRRIQPGKKSYFVLIGIDISGSTIGKNIVLAKRAAMAQAELCNRMGIKFAVFAHSGWLHSPGGTRSSGMDLDIYIIKDASQPWNEETKEALRALGPDKANLDGHTLEYYRRFIERRSETDKIILYYSDGKMPAENHDEELEILQREIKTCKRKNIMLLGVGIRTDSPVRHGLDTVQVDTDEDIVKVVKHLEKRIERSSRTG